VFEQGAYADRALHAEAAGLEPRDRALATALAYGTVQRRGTLDHLAGALSSRPPGTLDPPILAAIHLGLFQLLYLDGVAEHAAVNESVELAKRSPARSGAALVNAVLRRAARERRALLEGLDDGTAAAAAIAHSVPQWLAERWFAELGAREARALLARINEPAEVAVRANSLLGTAQEVLSRLPVPGLIAPGVPEGIVIEGPFDAHASELWRAGAIMPQSRGSMLVARLLAPVAGDRVLDLCAAPGAKTTHLAALMSDRGEVVAVERHPGRARALALTCSRMRATCVRVEAADAAAVHLDDAFDRVLVDPPCSGLGTLQSRPDLRWRASPEAIVELADVQARILAAGGAATAPGGVLVYSVCTISPPEGERVVERFVAEHPQFAVDDLHAAHPEWTHRGPYLQLLPHRDGTDGFFIARLRRA
jgi:16S rRNA (cytosine967-C5)-methyltransferase